MATSVDKLLGGGGKDNYVSSSDSDVDGEGEIPSSVVRPSADGLPQVRYTLTLLLACLLTFMLPGASPVHTEVY